MAVALRNYTQGTSQGSGTVSIAWPSGTIAGDLAVLVAQDYNTNGPTTFGGSGWTAVGRGVWWKRVTTGDLAQPLGVKGRTTFLQTFSGASRIGTWRSHEGLTLTKAGAGLFVDGWGPSRVNTIDPGATDRLGNQIRLVTDNTPNAVWFRAATTTGYKELTDHDDDCSYVSYEILPTDGPKAPIQVEPASGAAVDNNAPILISWLHQSNSGAAQEAAQVRLRVVGTGTWYYAQTAGTITTTNLWLTQSAQSTTINAGVLTTGSQYEWQVSTQDAGIFGPFSPTRTFTPVVPPTVNSITPTSPAESLTPSIAWTRTANVGSPEAWQVRISPSTDATPDTPLWDSLVTSGSATTTIAPATVGWTNGQTLYAWVRVMQTGGMWSPWTKDNATFTVSWTPPAAPTAVTPANQADGPLQVTIDGIPVGFSTYLEMSYDNATWVPVANDYENLAPTPIVNRVFNPSFETGTSSWGGANCTIVSTSSNNQMVQSGTNQLLATSDGTATVVDVSVTAFSYRPAVLPGQWVGYRSYTATESANHQTRIQLAWRDGAGAGNGSVASTWTAAPFYTGYTHTLVAQAPANTATVAYYLQLRDGNNTGSNVVAGKRMWADAVRIFVGNTQAEVEAALAEPYFDGSTPNTADYTYTWTGTAHLSATTRDALRVPTTIDVPLAAYGAAAYYRARTSNVISGVTLYSNWTTSAPLASTDDNSYFVDDDNAYLVINIREEQGPSIIQGVTVTYGHGATRPRQDQTAPQGTTGTLTLITRTILEEFTLREWLNNKGSWTTRWVPEINPGSGKLLRLNTRMALAKAIAVQHVIQTANAARNITFEWVEQ